MKAAVAPTPTRSTTKRGAPRSAATDVPAAAPAAGASTRQRLLHTALRLFAQQGYATTSTREIAEQAQVNVAAISYHFGDKAGLYRASFLEPFWAAPEGDGRIGDHVIDHIGQHIDGRAGGRAGADVDAAGAEAHCAAAPYADQSLDAALRALYTGFVEPLKHGDLAHLSIKLHCREMLEPTGLWEQEIDFGIAPMHRALVSVLCRHLGLRRADDDLQRLAVCIAGLGVHLHMGHDVIDALAPRLNRLPQAFDRWVVRLVGYAEAMVAAEAQRRARPTHATHATHAAATTEPDTPTTAATRRRRPQAAAHQAAPATSATALKRARR